MKKVFLSRAHCLLPTFNHFLSSIRCVFSHSPDGEVVEKKTWTFTLLFGSSDLCLFSCFLLQWKSTCWWFHWMFSVLHRCTTMGSLTLALMLRPPSSLGCSCLSCSDVADVRRRREIGPRCLLQLDEHWHFHYLAAICAGKEIDVSGWSWLQCLNVSRQEAVEEGAEGGGGGVTYFTFSPFNFDCHFLIYLSSHWQMDQSWDSGTLGLAAIVVVCTRLRHKIHREQSRPL